MKDFIVAIFLIGGLAFSGCSKKSTEENASLETTEKPEISNAIHLDANGQKEAGIAIDRVRSMPIKEKITVPARIDYDQRRLAHLTARVAGRVDRVSAFLGDRVKAGQTLATLYSQEYLVAQSEFIQAEQRIDRLTARGDTTEELATATSICESAREKLMVIGASKEDVDDLIKNHAPKTMLEIHAPFDGTVVETNDITGHFVEVGALLFHVADLSSVWIVADLHEKDISFLSTGMEAVIEATAYPGETFRGRLTRIFDVVDDQTRTIKTRIEADNGNRRLKPGMFASATLTTRRPAMIPALPSEAVLRDGDKRFVFAVRNDSTFVKRIIEVGDETREWVGISGGVKEGEKVVTRGAFALKSEMLKASFGGEE